MRFSNAFLQAITEKIQLVWERSLSIETVTSVSGGDINEAARLTLSDGRALFLKYNEQPLPNLFEIEARGLALLRRTSTLRVPEVYVVEKATATHPAYVLMEWIASELSSGSGGMREFGHRLARLHQQTSERYGLDHDNYIGSLPQRNTQTASWIAFYRDQRLGVQCEHAKHSGRLPPHREHLLDRLMERLDRFIDGDTVQPSLLHGDLWGGNYLICLGEAVLIDPAVYYGHREVELAFTELFGGFPPAFYAGYNEVWPLPAGYVGRKALYQLYPLLVHLNLFGESYGMRVDSVLKRYVGSGK
ncbi:MAG: fructosamine kinase family protein [Candidatus Bipolaricaulia bacterium]